MPQFFTDPSIALRGMQDPNEALSRFFQLKMLAEDRASSREERAEMRRMRGIQEREALLRLKQLEQQAGEQEAVRGAMAAGVRPALQAPQGREGRLGVNIPASFDRNSALAALAQGEGAHLLPGVEADFAAQDAKMQQAAIETATQLQKLSNEQFKQVKETADYLDQQITGFLGVPAEQRPALWPQVRAQQPPQIQQMMPEEYPGDGWLIQQATGSQEWKRVVDAEETARHNKAMENKSREPVPGRDVPYPPDVEAQRTRMNAARAQQAGLSPQQFSKVQSLASQFDSNPVVKTYNEQVNKYEGIKSIVDAGLGGPADLALVFEFMKGLDPTSVVRESEYATAAKSGNIFLGTMAKFNGYFKEEGGFLPDNVKQSFLEIVKKKMDISGKQVKAMHGDFARRIDKITGRGDGSEYLTDYSTLYQGGGQAGVTVQTPQGPITFPNQQAADAFKKAAGIK